jgi:hypothetical protein
MYKYNHCCPQQKLVPTPCLSPPIVSRGPGAIPESMRTNKSVCGGAWVSVPVGTTGCPVAQPYVSTVSTGNIQKSLIPVTPGSPMPQVNVGTVPASTTSRQRGEATNTSDPYDPATRFAVYFPTPPIPYQCPERLPSLDPKPSTRPCLPPRLFHGSVKT